MISEANQNLIFLPLEGMQRSPRNPKWIITEGFGDKLLIHFLSLFLTDGAPLFLVALFALGR